MFEEQRFQQGLWPSERRAFEQVDRLREIQETTFCRAIEQPKRARDAQTSFFGHAKAIPLIDQQQVGVQGFGQGDRRGFSFVQAGDSRQAGGVVNLKPYGRVGDPEMYRRRCESTGKFGMHGVRERNSFKHAGKKLDMPDLDQVVNRAGIGNYQPHGSEPQFFESLTFLLEVFKRVVLIDAMGFEKTIQLDAGQPQHLTQLRFGDAAGPEFFKREGFKRPALQFIMDGFAAQ